VTLPALTLVRIARDCLETLFTAHLRSAPSTAGDAINNIYRFTLSISPLNDTGGNAAHLAHDMVARARNRSHSPYQHIPSPYTFASKDVALLYQPCPTAACNITFAACSLHHRTFYFATTAAHRDIPIATAAPACTSYCAPRRLSCLPTVPAHQTA